LGDESVDGTILDEGATEDNTVDEMQDEMLDEVAENEVGDEEDLSEDDEDEDELSLGETTIEVVRVEEETDERR
jgi:hypothetical protein